MGDETEGKFESEAPGASPWLAPALHAVALAGGGLLGLAAFLVTHGPESRLSARFVVADRDAGAVVALDEELVEVGRTVLPSPVALAVDGRELWIACAVGGWSGGEHVLFRTDLAGELLETVRLPPVSALVTFDRGRVACAARRDSDGSARVLVLSRDRSAQAREPTWVTWATSPLDFDVLESVGGALVVGDRVGHLRLLRSGRQRRDVFLPGPIHEVRRRGSSLFVTCGRGPAWLVEVDATRLVVLRRVRAADVGPASSAAFGGERFVLHPEGLSRVEAGSLYAKRIAEPLGQAARFVRGLGPSRSPGVVERADATAVVQLAGALVRLDANGRSLTAQGGFDSIVAACALGEAGGAARSP